MSFALKRLIWDFDGTLYDTYSQLTHAMLCAIDDLGFQAQPAEAYALLKRSVYHAACAYADRFGLDASDIMAAFLKRHNEVTNFPLSPGADDCLHRTSRAGCRQYLFTHRDRSAVDQLRQDDLYRYFDDAVLRGDGFPDKPAPDAILHLMRKHGFAPEDAYMIGDRDLDIEAGRNAGVHTILYDPLGFYPDLQADYRVTELRQITELMLRLNA